MKTTLATKIKSLCHSLLILAITLLLLFPSCNAKKEAETPIQKAEIHGSVHSITMERHEPYFIEQPGRDLFIANCITCHTTRYIYAQPDFPRKTWQAEVNKMIEKFGAPISPDNVHKLVDYLTKIKGK